MQGCAFEACWAVSLHLPIIMRCLHFAFRLHAVVAGAAFWMLRRRKLHRQHVHDEILTDKPASPAGDDFVVSTEPPTYAGDTNWQPTADAMTSQSAGLTGIGSISAATQSVPGTTSVETTIRQPARLGVIAAPGPSVVMCMSVCACHSIICSAAPVLAAACSTAMVAMTSCWRSSSLRHALKHTFLHGSRDCCSVSHAASVCLCPAAHPAIPAVA